MLCWWGRAPAVYFFAWTQRQLSLALHCGVNKRTHTYRQERDKGCHLALTALSGTVVNISMSVAKFD